MNEIIVISKESLKNTIRTLLLEFEENKKAKDSPKLYTINMIAKKLGKAHATVKKLVEAGYLKTTKDGLVTDIAVNEYLNNE